MLFYSSLFVLWFFGAFFTGNAISILGEKKPDTIGDCFTGDYTLDLWACLLWPLFWVAFAGMRLARVVFEHFDDA